MVKAIRRTPARRRTLVPKRKPTRTLGGPPRKPKLRTTLPARKRPGPGGIFRRGKSKFFTPRKRRGTLAQYLR